MNHRMMHRGVMDRMMDWSMMDWSMMDRVMDWRMMNSVMDWRMVDGTVTNAQVSLQPPALSLTLSKHHLVEAVAHRGRGLGGLVPGGLWGLVHRLCVHGAHGMHPLVPQAQAGEAHYHQCGQIFL